MKKILFLSIGAALLLSACEKDSLGVSSITTYATVEVLGDQASTLPVGGTYTELGCLAMEGALDITTKVVTTGSVDTSTPGVYTITYTVANAQGFTSFNRRYVGIIDAAATAMDISGNYKRNAGAFGVATITKSATYPGLYINNNPGGIDLSKGAAPIPIYMFQWTATKIGAPMQSSTVGEFACKNGTYDNVNKKYTWSCVNAGYGTSARTFIKQ